jgi:hypothetical protein
MAHGRMMELTAGVVTNGEHSIDVEEFHKKTQSPLHSGELKKYVRPDLLRSYVKRNHLEGTMTALYNDETP